MVHFSVSEYYNCYIMMMVWQTVLSAAFSSSNHSADEVDTYPPHPQRDEKTCLGIEPTCTQMQMSALLRYSLECCVWSICVRALTKVSPICSHGVLVVRVAHLSEDGVGMRSGC